MRLFLFLVGVVSLMSPILAFHLDGGSTDDEADWYHWLATRHLDQHVLMQSMVLAGLIMIAAACGVKL